MNGAWWGYIWLMFVVALNRLLVIIQYKYEPRIFSARMTRVSEWRSGEEWQLPAERTRICICFQIYILIGWIFVFVFYITCQTDLQGLLRYHGSHMVGL